MSGWDLDSWVDDGGNFHFLFGHVAYPDNVLGYSEHLLGPLPEEYYLVHYHMVEGAQGCQSLAPNPISSHLLR